MISARTKNQHLATFFICLQKVSFGAITMWMSPALLELTSVTEPLLPIGPITPLQISWILIGGAIGNLVGIFFYGAIVDKIGRKSCLLLSALGQIVSIILLLVPRNLLILCISRFIYGSLDCGGFVIHIMFLREIADDRIRGRLGTSITVSALFGYCLVLLVATYFNYYVYTGLFIIFPIGSFLLLLIGIPDSPQGLMARNKIEEAEKSLQFYRNDKNLKLSQWNNSGPSEQKQDISIWKELKVKSVRKAFLIGTVLVIFEQFCGLTILNMFAGIIFRQTGSIMSPNMSSVVLNVFKLVGSFLSTLLVDRLGRKVLFSFSGFGIALGHTGLGVFMFCQEEVFMDLSSYSWIPLICLGLSLFSGSLGILCIFYTYCQEIFPARISKLANGYVQVLSIILSIITANVFPILSEVVGMHCCLFFFAICSFGGALFCIFVLPETKGKSLEEIEKLMK